MSDARRYGRRAFKALMRSHHFKIPKYDLPLRIRPVSCDPSPIAPKPFTPTVVRLVDSTYHADACPSGPHEHRPLLPTQR